MRRIFFMATLILGMGLSLTYDASAQSRFFTFERGVDRPGLDYKNIASPGAAQCSFSCQAENQCRAWTYVRPGIQGPSGRCWLKTAVPRASRNSCCTSGVRTSRAVPID